MDGFHIFKRFLKRFAEARQGNVAIIFGVMMLPTMVLLGGLVDYGMAIKTKSQLTATLDAAMLAAMLQYADDKDLDYQMIIETYIDKNFTQTDKKMNGTTIEVRTAEVLEGGEMVTSITATVPTNFLKFVHFDQFQFSVSSGVMVGGSTLEVALVLDNTGSMSGSKIASLKTSAKRLVNAIMPDEGSDVVKVAIIPFADYVNIGMDNRAEGGLDIPADYRHSWTVEVPAPCNNGRGGGGGWGWGWGHGNGHGNGNGWGNNCTTQEQHHEDYAWFGCMGSRLHDDPDVFSDEFDILGVPGLMTQTSNCNHVETVTRLTNSKSEVLSALDDMNSSGWTYIPAGLAWGWRAITDHAPFADGVPYSDKSVKKAIVLMTDGSNTRAMQQVTGNGVLHHEGAVYDHSSGSSSNANTVTAELCQSIKANDILVYTIAFDVQDGSSVQTLMKNCAGNGGQYFDADNSTELADAFRQIGLSLLNLRVSH